MVCRDAAEGKWGELGFTQYSVSFMQGAENPKWKTTQKTKLAKEEEAVNVGLQTMSPTLLTNLL